MTAFVAVEFFSIEILAAGIFLKTHAQFLALMVLDPNNPALCWACRASGDVGLQSSMIYKNNILWAVLCDLWLYHLSKQSVWVTNFKCPTLQ